MIPMDKHAVMSPDRAYRYRLDRRWGSGQAVVFLMLNPSTADADKDDATIRKCMGFARRWGNNAITVVNLYARRETNPALLHNNPDPVGPSNDAYIEEAVRETGAVIAAWGASSAARLDRVRHVDHLVRRFTAWMCLDCTGQGHPRHPLMMPYAAKLRHWRLKEGRAGK